MLDSSRQLKLEALYREEYTALCRFLLERLPNAEDAEELAQDAYLRLCKADKVQAIENPRNFLYKIAINLVIDRYRSAKHRADEISDDELGDSEQLVALTRSPEYEAATQQQLDTIAGAIRELPPRCKQVFIMHRFEHITHSEIAKRLGISRQMVEKHIAKAVLRCREALREPLSTNKKRNER